MSSQQQERHKRKERRKTRPKTPGPETRSRTPTADGPGFWARRGWPCVELNGDDRTPPVSKQEKKSRNKPDEKPEEARSFRKASEQRLLTNPTHDEFSVKSIVISAVLASSILAGAFYLAKMIVDIMAKE